MKKDSKNWQNLIVLDKALFKIVKGIDILSAVSPLNFKQQKEEFFSSNFTVNPRFEYSPHNIELFKRKRELFNLPVDRLQDSDLQELYTDVIQSYVDKLDQYRSVGSSDFFYDSLRYFGEPAEKDMRNAQFILHLPDNRESETEKFCDATDIVSYFKEFSAAEGYQYELKLDDSMIVNAIASGTTVKVNGAANVSETEMHALAHHELGVHLVTTLNGREQPLTVLSLGCPVNTTTQEGLAILSEYLSGSLTLNRLQVLALRVLAVDSMIRERDFKKTFLFLQEQYRVEENLAFGITARIYRGGGFTKDYLYLKGFHEMLNAYESRPDFLNLLCGKVSLEYLSMITRLIDKGYLISPCRISPSIRKPAELDSVRAYIAHAIK